MGIMQDDLCHPYNYYTKYYRTGGKPFITMLVVYKHVVVGGRNMHAYLSHLHACYC
jgi:hypothetical protein